MSKTVLEQARDIRQQYRRTAESITYTSGNHGTTSAGEQWTAAPGYGACIYQSGPGAFVATVGETWKPTRFDGWCLINQTRRRFLSRKSARVWCAEQATAAGYPIQTARPAYDLFTV